MSAPRRLIVILGPTASGKSALAIRLAEKLAGEVVCCDSTQVYSHFDIGTGKVPLDQRRGIPHHLLDLVEPDDVFTAGEYRRRAADVLGEISSRGKIPILTAGTGLYLRALLEGLADAPQRSEELRTRLREIVSERGAEYLHKILSRLDRESASRIAPRDTQKIIRALEVRLLSGESASELHRRSRSGLQGFQVAKIGLSPPRQALYARIDRRVEEMIQAGWLEEVKRLIESGISLDSKPFSFIGYSQLADHLKGKAALQETLVRIQQATRQYAKRQITWFRREREVLWFHMFGDEPEAFVQALTALGTYSDHSHTIKY
jgi:tRNA dimethylallyltransferase